VHDADRLSVGSIPPYAHRSRWPCYGTIFGITATSSGGLSYKIPSAVRLHTPHRSVDRHCRRHRVLTSPLAFTAGQLVQHIPRTRSTSTSLTFPSVRTPLTGTRPTAAVAAGHRRAPTPATPPPNYGHPPDLGEHLDELCPLPDWEHHRSRWIPASPPPLGSRDPIAWPQFFPGV
jgi:hypothetical protein